MLTTIKGRYENGTLILEEKAPVDVATVMVTFMEPEVVVPAKKPQLGFAKGFFGPLPPDFDEPLEDLKDYM